MRMPCFTPIFYAPIFLVGDNCVLSQQALCMYDGIVENSSRMARPLTVSLGFMIFISYSRKDASLVNPLVELLRASEQDVFVDFENIAYGSNWQASIENAIHECDRFLLFWSKSSMMSPYVKKEWQLVLENPKCCIIPILLDRTPLPKELEEFQGVTELEKLFKSINGWRWTRRIVWPLFIALGILIYSYSSFKKLGPGPVDDLLSKCLFFVVAIFTFGVPALIMWLISHCMIMNNYNRASKLCLSLPKTGDK